MRIMGESDEGGDGFSVTLETARQAAEASDPGQVRSTMQRLGKTSKPTAGPRAPEGVSAAIDILSGALPPHIERPTGRLSVAVNPR